MVKRIQSYKQEYWQMFQSFLTTHMVSPLHENYVALKKVKFALEQATKAHRGVEVYFYSFFNLGSRWGVGR